MPDYVPDNIDEYVESVKRIDRLANVVNNDATDEFAAILANAAVGTVEHMIGVGLDPLEAVSAVSSIVTGVLCAWYDALPEAEDE